LLRSPAGKEKLKSYKKEKEPSMALMGGKNGEDIAMGTGCTACSCFVTASEIVCFNSGDSRCVLGYRESSGRLKAVEMSYDHKPDNEGEKRRIEKAGGFVEENRVKGVLNLSRSLGDLEYK
jgi:serine/threonine protein phosphatase PrpC